MASVSVPCTCTITKNKNNANKPTINCLCRIGGTNVARVSSGRSNKNVLNSMEKQVAAAANTAAAAAIETASSSYNNAPSRTIEQVLRASTGPNKADTKSIAKTNLTLEMPGDRASYTVTGNLGKVVRNNNSRSKSNTNVFMTQTRKREPPITKVTSTFINPQPQQVNVTAKTITNPTAPPPSAPQPPPSSSPAARPSITPVNESPPSLLSQIQGIKLKETEMGKKLGITGGGRRTRKGKGRDRRRTRRVNRK